MVFRRTLARMGLIPVVDPSYYHPTRPLTSYLLLPGRTHGKYEYPDTLVSLERDIYTDVNWHKFQEKLHKKHTFALSLRQGLDFLLLLTSNEKIYDGKGNKIPDLRKASLLYELRTQNGTMQSEEQLDAYFDICGGALTLQTEHRFNRRGELESFYSEEVGTALRKDCRIELASCNRAGLPLKEGNDLGYVHPPGSPSSIAKFIVDRKEGLALHCTVDPHFHDEQSYYVVRECCYK